MRVDHGLRTTGRDLRRWGVRTAAATLLATAGLAVCRTALSGPGEFRVGRPAGLEELPAGARLRTQLEQLPPVARERGLRWLRSFHFTDGDLPSLHADPAGGIFYVCPAAADRAEGAVEPPVSPLSSVPASPFPTNLVFHSRPGAPNVLFIDFSGETVTNTDWNLVVGRTQIPAMAFSSDADYSTFSDSEQVVIKRVWQRVAEDCAPFNIDVTTERPATFGTRTAVALVTRNTDANGDPNPYNTGGGVSYVNVFGTFNYASYRPAWIYHDNLSHNESYIAEAVSHEIGHNMGLSHDGRTDGIEYYTGHGSGETSWGTIMGAAYNRNVTQWSKGEYYRANNTQDDLATIAGKLSYRTDDFGNTAGTATELVFSDGTNIVSTTPENDPANASPGNKGVLERNTDVDVFSFVTGSGTVSLAVSPWVMPAGTRGGNTDILLELYDEAGALLLTNNPADQTAALFQTNLNEGRYYLYVRNSGAGDPLAATPTGYTTYGSVGQYFIAGYVTDAGGYNAPPTAELHVTDLTQSGQTNKTFSVVYSDDGAVDVSTVDSSDIRVTGPNGYDQLAALVSLDIASDGTPRTATYSVTPPGGGIWSSADDGPYLVFMESAQVSDTEGAQVAAGLLGQFEVSVPAAVFMVNMDTDPGWTLEPEWQYGAPAYGETGPTAGYTGTNIVAYNLSGNYANNLSARYATTAVINGAGYSNLTLRFRRWLRVRPNDPVSIQVSTNGTDWTTVWSTSSAVSDNSWQEVQYALPAFTDGSSSIQLRWSLASNKAQNDIGWNIDDVELLGAGALDTTAPVPALSVADLTMAGSPSHSCSVTYTDDTAVRLSSLDGADLEIVGPNGYSNLAEFVGADLPEDGSPLTGSYSIPAPGGTWDEPDNGSYTVTLLENAVEDVSNNAVTQTVLGAFTVAISPPPPGELTVSPAEELEATGTEGGPFAPSSIEYTLANTGGMALEWTAGVADGWLSLSATGGVLLAGASTGVTVSINEQANLLSSGGYTGVVEFANASTGNGSTNRCAYLTVHPPLTFELSVAVNNPAWGSVIPAGGVYAAGSPVELLATPANYFLFREWSGDTSGTNNPTTVVLDTNRVVLATFGEILTTNWPTPHWWLAVYGFTNDFENAVTNVGANGLAMWQSYIAGLDPSNPDSRLLLQGRLGGHGEDYVLEWTTVSGRVYTISSGTDLMAGFAPMTNAVDLPPAIRAVTNGLDGAPGIQFYRLEVRKP